MELAHALAEQIQRWYPSAATVVWRGLDCTTTLIVELGGKRVRLSLSRDRVCGDGPTYYFRNYELADPASLERLRHDFQRWAEHHRLTPVSRWRRWLCWLGVLV